MGIFFILYLGKRIDDIEKSIGEIMNDLGEDDDKNMK